MESLGWLSICIFTFLFVSQALSEENLGYDHRAHSVPGHDKTLYDLYGAGYVTVKLDGSGSHSHFFDQGPPVRSGVITSYRWIDSANNKTICKQESCAVKFKVGNHTLRLRVKDSTNSVAEDICRITILPEKDAKHGPIISEVSPNKGPDTGMNIVSIIGKNMYHDSVVYFGKALALNVKHVDLQTIVCTAPEGHGTAYVRVVSSKGNSNFMKYQYQVPAAIPIKFKKGYWKNKDGSNFGVEMVTDITIGWDHRYYLVNRPGYVTGVSVGRNLIVENSCTGAYVGDGRSIGGIAYNPLDKIKRLFISTNEYYWLRANGTWDNGKIESVYVDENGCPKTGEVIISGLPVSNHDHGINKIIFDKQGRMYVSIGGTTNGGVSEKGDKIGGIKESVLTGSIALFDYLKPGFNGTLTYSQYDDPGTTWLVSGDAALYAAGFRNCFGLLFHRNGRIYATDNGPNVGFGKMSTSCNTSTESVETRDKVLLIKPGTYYGHPNRNRGRWHKIQCSYKNTWDPSGRGYMEPIGLTQSSTNGIIDYKANSFQGALRDNLFLSKVAFGSQKGILWRAELSEDGTFLESGPYIFKEESGLSITQGLWGEIVMPQLEKMRVLVYMPHEEPSLFVSMLNVYPARGPKSGGTEIMITGTHLNETDIQVLVGGEHCTGIRDVHFDSLKCTTPPGKGKVDVILKQEEIESASFGFDFEYM